MFSTFFNVVFCVFAYISCSVVSAYADDALMFSKDVSVLSQSWHFVNTTPHRGFIAYARFRRVVTELHPKQLGVTLAKYV